MAKQFVKTDFEERVLREEGFYNILLNGKQVGFNLDLRLNYYRGLPLSCVQKAEVTVDGEKIPDYLILAELNEKGFTISQMKEIYTEYWGIMTPMHLRIFNYGLEPGEHDVDVRIELKTPSGTPNGDECEMIDGSARKKMRIGDGREM